MTKLFSQPGGASPITEEQKEGLLQKWVSTQEELNQIEQNNIQSAQEWLFHNRQKKADYADITFLMKLHKRMFNEVYSWAGDLRQKQTNIGVEPYQIRPDVATLKLDLEAWIENNSYLQDEIAVRYHHKLVSIHPFLNGNGRLSRLMADYINEQIFENQPFSWGSDNLYIQNKARLAYLEAIYHANDNNITPLVEFARAGS